ncbi:uncharacterized protein LOC128857916 [Anastrepha ludens]|uniref:uncharacterized protein LOC128857916 n=1 Tax=Anastrepha ludens TaxID=28586 RepID=UPI0023B1575C|nr:uncharacterized protein LOC128857916 [Anastrepha ludens]XP_053949734.1 uncharacterized protein LOC128857916 [Anastrepha ludens]XP_053949735.1 uncharacterized protein LOC128857916 [Anastrepha ludens]
MNIGSPIFVPRNSAPMASTSAAIKTVAGTLEPKSPYASPRAISPTTVGQNMDTNNNVEGYWPLFNNATAFYSCDVNSNYLQYCQQKQQQYFQNFFQRQRTLPNFHIQWTQRKAINAAIGQRQQRKVTKAAAMAAEVTSSPSQQSRKKQKTQQQATKQQLLFEQQQQQQQVDATKFTTKDKTTDISNDSFSPLSNSATMLLLLKSTAEIVSIDVANENVLSENNKNKHINNDNVVIPKEDDNMTTLTPISDAIAALPNQSNQISKLVAEPEEPTKKGKLRTS